LGFKIGHGPITVDLNTWVKANPILQVLTKKRGGTSRKYLNAIRVYFADFLNSKFSSVEDWIESVKRDQASDDFEVQTRWASDLEQWVLSHSGWNERTRRGYVAAIQSFLEYKIGRQNARNYKFSYQTETERENRGIAESDRTTVDYTEIRRLVHSAKSKRDRALVLTVLSGLGVGEFLDFNRKWYTIYSMLKSRTPKTRWKEELLEPVRVPGIPDGRERKECYLLRRKRNVPFYTFLVDDQIDALADLVDEREAEIGRPLTKDDPLFVTTWGESMTDHRAQEQIRYLREQSEIDKPERLKIHEMGRDTLQTLIGNMELKERERNYGDFVLGHTIDPLKYDKNPWTSSGEKGISDLFEKLRPTLNLITKRGEPKTEIVKEIIDPVARNQNELLLGIVKQAGLLTPEILESLARTKAKGKLAELTQKELEYLDELEERKRREDQSDDEAE
jgi:hypothetical protein